MATHVPDGQEDEPSSDADDDFDERATTAERRKMSIHTHAAEVAIANGVPARRPSVRARLPPARKARMNDMEARGELV